MHRPETNPHFRRPLQPDRRAQHSQLQPQDHPDQPQPQPQPPYPYSEPTTPWVPPPQDPPARAPRLKKNRQDPYPQPPTQSPSQSGHPEQPQRQGSHGQGSQSQDQPARPPRSKKHRQAPYSESPTPQGPKSKSPDQHVQQPRPRVQILDPLSQPSDSREPHPNRRDDHRPQHSDRRNQQNILLMPLPRQTNPLMWFGAVFCAIFWVLVIVGGLAVLIVYLIFRPKSPRFDVATANLNAAYLDMGYLLNADLNFLANFTNPNKKVSVDFSSMIVSLYYGNTLVATQFIAPFSASKQESMLMNIHMVSSQVRLPRLERQRLQQQMETNGITLDVKGIFRARSNFGTLLRYSYWLHSYCSLLVGGPPDGVLIRSKCRTKH